MVRFMAIDENSGRELIQETTLRKSKAKTGDSDWY